MSGISKLREEYEQRLETVTHERGVDRVDIREVGLLADIIKDLSEAEACLWKAQHYRNEVSDAMEKKYGGGPGTPGVGGYERAYEPQMRSNGMDRGNHREVMERLRTAIQSASPDDRKMLRDEATQILGLM